MVGGVLVERKVGEVEPALIGNRDKVRYTSANNISQQIAKNVHPYRGAYI